LLDLAVPQNSFIKMQDIRWFQVWIQMIKIQRLIKQESTMSRLKNHNNSG
jgi:hypothetical protein